MVPNSLPGPPPQDVEVPVFLLPNHSSWDTTESWWQDSLRKRFLLSAADISTLSLWEQKAEITSPSGLLSIPWKWLLTTEASRSFISFPSLGIFHGIFAQMLLLYHCLQDKEVGDLINWRVPCYKDIGDYFTLSHLMYTMWLRHAEWKGLLQFHTEFLAE